MSHRYSRFTKDDHFHRIGLHEIQSTCVALPSWLSRPLHLSDAHIRALRSPIETLHRRIQCINETLSLKFSHSHGLLSTPVGHSTMTPLMQSIRPTAFSMFTASVSLRCPVKAHLFRNE